MIVVAMALLGAVLGALVARRRGGNRLDIAQYGAVYCMAFIVLGLALTIVIHRVLA